jgi:hypothetical protein
LAVLWLFFGCSLAVLWLFFGCSLAVLWLFFGCSLAVFRCSHQNTETATLYLKTLDAE